MSTATSHSDRMKAARDALKAHDEGAMEQYALADALRTIVEAPDTVESVEKIAMNVYKTVHSFPVPIDGDLMRDLIGRGVKAGIQAAWGSWEPDDYAPMLCANCGGDAADALTANGGKCDG